MAAERFDYPTAASPTSSFIPTYDADWTQSSQGYDPGILREQSAGKQEYGYKEGIRVRVFTHVFRNQTNADRAEFEAFVDAVAGRQFQFTDWNATVRNVKFAQDEFTFRYREGVNWDWDVVLREELT